MAAIDKWTFILVKATTGEAIGEIQMASERKLTLAFSRPSTASFKIRADNPLLKNLYAEDTALRVFQGSTLRFYGPVLTVQLQTEESGAPTVAVTAADVSWYLSRRIVGTGTTEAGILANAAGNPGGYIGKLYFGAPGIDKGEVAKKIIENEATNGANRSGHMKVSSTFLSGSLGVYVAGPFKTALTCINDLANGVDGFDWVIKPVLEGDVWGEFYAVPVLGTVRTTVLEYGPNTLGNIRSTGYIRDLTGTANKAFHLPEELHAHGTIVSGAYVENYPLVLSASDATSEGEHQVLEDIAEASGITNTTMREEWLTDYINIKKNPRKVVSLALDQNDATGRVPIYGTDFELGDFVTARGVFGGVTLFNGSVRVYAVEFELNENGDAKVTPILLDDNNDL